jgi:geranylgeranyl diphosphate synthase type II
MAGEGNMDAKLRIEQALDAALRLGESTAAPSRLVAATRHAVFPGGARIRPRLCLAVAWACGDDRPALADAAAVAIELLHCASLVHDDLPCFDAAAMRRGQASVHAAFGERLAVLVGDALIVLAFRAVAEAGRDSPERLGRLISTVADGVGAPDGIVAGQAWECEPKADLATYQRAKTGALFAAATAAGAQAAGHDPEAWRSLGDRLGEAYQVADDIRDVMADPVWLGKPIGRDEDLDRMSSARSLGLPGAVARFDDLLDRAVRSIPACRGAAALRALVQSESERLVPKAWVRRIRFGQPAVAQVGG